MLPALILSVLLLAVSATAGCGSREESAGTSPDAATTAAASATVPSRNVTVESITQTVSSIRGLPIRKGIDVQYRDPADIRQDMQKEIDREYPPRELDVEERTMKMMGLIDPDVKLRDALSQLLGEEVAGYYDDDTKELVIVSNQRELTAMNEVTLSHEVTHALQDQNFDLKKISPEDTGNDDEDLARLALIEGDATLTMQEYTQRQLSGWDQLGLGLESMGGAGAITEAPPYLDDVLSFPYVKGMDFVTALKRKGGWDLVNQAYRRPPDSTEQILHPEKYLAGEEPVPVNIPALDAAGGWQQKYETVMGEFDLQELLLPDLSTAQAKQAAAGWGGGKLRYYEDGSGRSMVVMVVDFDTAPDAAEFARAMKAGLENRYQGKFGPEAGASAPVLSTADGVWMVGAKGDAVAVVVSPSAATSSDISGQLVGSPAV